MTTLTVYGKKDGTEKVIFGNLFDSPAAMRKARAAEQI